MERRYADLVRGAPLQYASDYVSFVGADSLGRVCFALDSNRGYDADPPGGGDRLQAEHAYAVLHDERTGWVDLTGVTRYPHPGPEVTVLPDSAWFAFTGAPDTGLSVRSTPNDLLLSVDPLQDRLVGQDADTLFVMRSAAATLTWRGRTLTGRVLFEGLATTAMNLLSRRTFTGLAGLEFLYLLAGSGSGAADLYLQKTLGPQALAGLGPQVGFLSPPDAPASTDTTLPGLDVVTTGHAPAPGLFRWPTSWVASWPAPHATGGGAGTTVQVRTVSRRTVGRYGVAGFAMAVVTGTLTSPDGTVQEVYGFAELLALGPLIRALTGRRG